MKKQCQNCSIKLYKSDHFQKYFQHSMIFLSLSVFFWATLKQFNLL